MLISKKELLKITGISYGQLYRWKREGLIPEEWFLKQPSFTGQETFFPREKILNRIQAINELKDRYSLEELAALFSPELSGRLFTAEELSSVEEVDPSLALIFNTVLGKDHLGFPELLFLVCLSRWKQAFGLTAADAEGLCRGIRENLGSLHSEGCSLTLLRLFGGYYTCILTGKGRWIPDGRMEELDTVDLEGLSSKLRLKYQGKPFFHFTSEEKAAKNGAAEEPIDRTEQTEHTCRGDDGFSLQIGGATVRFKTGIEIDTPATGSKEDKDNGK